MRPIWKRKVGKWNRSFYINIPKEIYWLIQSKEVVITVDSGKVVIMDPKMAEKELGVKI